MDVGVCNPVKIKYWLYSHEKKSILIHIFSSYCTSAFVSKNILDPRCRTHGSMGSLLPLLVLSKCDALTTY